MPCHLNQHFHDIPLRQKYYNKICMKLYEILHIQVSIEKKGETGGIMFLKIKQCFEHVDTITLVCY